MAVPTKKELAKELTNQKEKTDILINQITIDKEWAELCVHTRCDAFCHEDKIPYEYLEQFSIVPLPELNKFTIENDDGESTTYIQGIYNFINNSPVETWFFCKYLEQELIQYHVFFDSGTDEDPDSNYVVWNPGHVHFNKRI